MSEFIKGYQDEYEAYLKRVLHMPRSKIIHEAYKINIMGNMLITLEHQEEELSKNPTIANKTLEELFEVWKQTIKPDMSYHQVTNFLFDL